MARSATVAAPHLQPAWLCQPDWTSIADAYGELEYQAASDPWLSLPWMRTWWECFGTHPQPRQLRLLYLTSARGWAACLPLFVQSGYGLRRLLPLGTDAQRRLPLLAPATAAQALPLLARALAARRDWDVLELRGVPLAFAQELATACRQAGLDCRLGAVTAQRFIPLDLDWAQVTAPWGASMLCKLARQERNLRKLAPLTLTTLTEPVTAAAAFEDCLRLEAAGWKGRARTAILSDPHYARFYRRLVLRLAADQRLRIILLHSGPSLLAFRLCTLSHGRLAGLKTGYDETWSKYSPGKVLLHMILRQAHQTGLREYDLLGGDDAGKSDWTPHARALVNLRACNTTPRGRLASLALALKRHYPWPRPTA